MLFLNCNMFVFVPVDPQVVFERFWLLRFIFESQENKNDIAEKFTLH